MRNKYKMLAATFAAMFGQSNTLKGNPTGQQERWWPHGRKRADHSKYDGKGNLKSETSQ